MYAFGAIYLHHLPISHGAYSHLFAVADDNAPRLSFRQFGFHPHAELSSWHQSQRDDWLTYAFSGVLCSPWDFAVSRMMTGFQISHFPSTCQRWNLHMSRAACVASGGFRRTYTHPRNTQVYFRPGGWWLPVLNGLHGDALRAVGFNWSPSQRSKQ